MKYTFRCDDSYHDEPYLFEVEASIKDGPPLVVRCPVCMGTNTRRNYQSDSPPVHYNAGGFSRDYFKKNPGRGQSWDKKENLNQNWSRYYNEEPPKEDSKGTYDGT